MSAGVVSVCRKYIRNADGVENVSVNLLTESATLKSTRHM